MAIFKKFEEIETIYVAQESKAQSTNRQPAKQQS